VIFFFAILLYTSYSAYDMPWLIPGRSSWSCVYALALFLCWETAMLRDALYSRLLALAVRRRTSIVTISHPSPALSRLEQRYTVISCVPCVVSVVAQAFRLALEATGVIGDVHPRCAESAAASGTPRIFLHAISASWRPFCLMAENTRRAYEGKISNLSS
jgi:hypothetical protein